MANHSSDPLTRQIARAMSAKGPADEIYLNRVVYVKRVVLGTLRPEPLSEEQSVRQQALLDRCLEESPSGKIIGREMLEATFAIVVPNGETPEVKRIHTKHEILHIGFDRKPFWVDSGRG